MQPEIPQSTLSELTESYGGPDGLWVVDTAGQRIFRWREDGTRESAPVSTAAAGLGNEPGSNRTPIGLHRVAAVIGAGSPLHREFIGRRPVPPSDREDRILARILWLDGLEPERNSASRERYIYIHGTNHVERLGAPASRGCIRMDPARVALWADALGARRPRVWIGNVMPES